MAAHRYIPYRGIHNRVQKIIIFAPKPHQRSLCVMLHDVALIVSAQASHLSDGSNRLYLWDALEIFYFATFVVNDYSAATVRLGHTVSNSTKVQDLQSVSESLVPATKAILPQCKSSCSSAQRQRISFRRSGLAIPHSNQKANRGRTRQSQCSTF